MQTEPLVDRDKISTGTERGQSEPPRARESAHVEQQIPERLRRPDRVPGQQQCPGLHPVADEGGAVVVEEIQLVGPQLEEAERVMAVLAHELGGHPPDRGARPAAGRCQRPEQHIRDPEQRPDHHQMDRERHPREADDVTERPQGVILEVHLAAS